MIGDDLEESNPLIEGVTYIGSTGNFKQRMNTYFGINEVGDKDFKCIKVNVKEKAININPTRKEIAFGRFKLSITITIPETNNPPNKKSIQKDVFIDFLASSYASSYLN